MTTQRDAETLEPRLDRAPRPWATTDQATVAEGDLVKPRGRLARFLYRLGMLLQIDPRAGSTR